MPRLSNLAYNFHVVKYEQDKETNELQKVVDKLYSQLKDIAEDFKDLTLKEITYLSKTSVSCRRKGSKYQGLIIEKIAPILKHHLF